jgi:hypothetical protein
MSQSSKAAGGQGRQVAVALREVQRPQVRQSPGKKKQVICREPSLVAFHVLTNPSSTKKQIEGLSPDG